MPEYIKYALKRFQHEFRARNQFYPHKHTPLSFGKTGERQYAKSHDTLLILDAKGIHLVQSIVGTFLYYTRAIDSTITTALNNISSEQAHATKHTFKKCKRLLDYAATYPSVLVCFYASDMILHINSNAAYLVKTKARSRMAVFLSGQYKILPIVTAQRSYSNRM